MQSPHLTIIIEQVLKGNLMKAYSDKTNQDDNMTHAVKSVEPNLGDFNYAAWR